MHDSHKIGSTFLNTLVNRIEYAELIKYFRKLKRRKLK